MAVKFDFYQTPVAPGAKKKVCYHARVVGSHTVNTAEITRRIQSACSLTRGDVKGALSALSEILVESLGAGDRVHLEGVGYFQITLECAETHDPAATHAQNVHFKTVKFRPDQILRKELRSEIHTSRSDAKFHSEQLSDIEIDGKLIEYFQDNPFLTRRRFEHLCGFTRTMALKHINRLIQEKRLKNTNTYNQPIYVPTPGNYGKSYSEESEQGERRI